MSKQDVYESITNRMIESLEKGVAPWSKPWQSMGLPISLSTHKPYRGINVLLLLLEGRGDPRWGTYKAIEAAGGQVRKGEKGTRVILWKPVKKKGEGDSDDSYLYMTSYTVFNAEQTEGLPELGGAEKSPFTPLERAQAVVDGFVFRVGSANLGPPVTHGGDRAAYAPMRDEILMPPQRSFFTAEGYYCTLFHELVHSTAHENRLKRVDDWTAFGTEPYGKEELVAEMGASFLCGMTEVECQSDQSASYIAGWLGKIKGDPKLVVQAAAAAQKAVDLIVGTAFDDVPAEDALEAIAA